MYTTIDRHVYNNTLISLHIFSGWIYANTVPFLLTHLRQSDEDPTRKTRPTLFTFQPVFFFESKGFGQSNGMSWPAIGIKNICKNWFF